VPASVLWMDSTSYTFGAGGSGFFQVNALTVPATSGVYPAMLVYLVSNRPTPNQTITQQFYRMQLRHQPEIVSWPLTTWRRSSINQFEYPLNWFIGTGDWVSKGGILQFLFELGGPGEDGVMVATVLDLGSDYPPAYVPSAASLISLDPSFIEIDNVSAAVPVSTGPWTVIKCFGGVGVSNPVLTMPDVTLQNQHSITANGVTAAVALYTSPVEPENAYDFVDHTVPSFPTYSFNWAWTPPSTNWDITSLHLKPQASPFPGGTELCYTSESTVYKDFSFGINEPIVELDWHPAKPFPEGRRGDVPADAVYWRVWVGLLQKPISTTRRLNVGLTVLGIANNVTFGQGFQVQFDFSVDQAGTWRYNQSAVPDGCTHWSCFVDSQPGGGPSGSPHEFRVIAEFYCGGELIIGEGSGVDDVFIYDSFPPGGTAARSFAQVVG
jgi:hypothetical protein